MSTANKKAERARQRARFADHVYSASEMPPPSSIKIDKPCEARFWNGAEWQLCEEQPQQPK